MPDKYIEEAVKIVEAVPAIGGLEPERVTLFDVCLEGYGEEVAGLVLAEAIASALRSRDEQNRREIEELREAMMEGMSRLERCADGSNERVAWAMMMSVVDRFDTVRASQLSRKEEKGV